MNGSVNRLCVRDFFGIWFYTTKLCVASCASGFLLATMALLHSTASYSADNGPGAPNIITQVWSEQGDLFYSYPVTISGNRKSSDTTSLSIPFSLTPGKVDYTLTIAPLKKTAKTGVYAELYKAEQSKKAGNEPIASLTIQPPKGGIVSLTWADTEGKKIRETTRQFSKDVSLAILRTGVKESDLLVQPQGVFESLITLDKHMPDAVRARLPTVKNNAYFDALTDKTLTKVTSSQKLDGVLKDNRILYRSKHSSHLPFPAAAFGNQPSLVSRLSTIFSATADKSAWQLVRINGPTGEELISPPFTVQEAGGKTSLRFLSIYHENGITFALNPLLNNENPVNSRFKGAQGARVQVDGDGRISAQNVKTGYSFPRDNSSGLADIASLPLSKLVPALDADALIKWLIDANDNMPKTLFVNKRRGRGFDGMPIARQSVSIPFQDSAIHTRALVATDNPQIGAVFGTLTLDLNDGSQPHIVRVHQDSPRSLSATLQKGRSLKTAMQEQVMQSVTGARPDGEATLKLELTNKGSLKLHLKSKTINITKSLTWPPHGGKPTAFSILPPDTGTDSAKSKTAYLNFGACLNTLIDIARMPPDSPYTTEASHLLQFNGDQETLEQRDWQSTPHYYMAGVRHVRKLIKAPLQITKKVASTTMRGVQMAASPVTRSVGWGYRRFANAGKVPKAVALTAGAVGTGYLLLHAYNDPSGLYNVANTASGYAGTALNASQDVVSHIWQTAYQSLPTITGSAGETTGRAILNASVNATK